MRTLGTPQGEAMPGRLFPARPGLAVWRVVARPVAVRSGLHARRRGRGFCGRCARPVRWERTANAAGPRPGGVSGVLQRCRGVSLATQDYRWRKV